MVQTVACEARGVDNGANGGLALGGPDGAITVGHLPLDHGRTNATLGAFVRGLDSGDIGEEDQELIATSADLGLDITAYTNRR